MATNPTISSLNGMTLEELNRMPQEDFSALLESVMAGKSETEKADLKKQISADFDDAFEMLYVQEKQLGDIIAANMKKGGDPTKLEQGQRLLDDIKDMLEFVDDFSSTWGTTDLALQAHNQVMTGTAFQFTYSGLEPRQGEEFLIDATQVAGAGGIFGATETAQADKPYLVLNMNPGDSLNLVDYDRATGTRKFSITSAPTTDHPEGIVRYVTITSTSPETAPAIKLASGTAGLTQDILETWPKAVLQNFYDSLLSEDSAADYIYGKSKDRGGKAGAKGGLGGKLGAIKLTPGLNLGNIKAGLAAGSLAAGRQTEDADENSGKKRRRTGQADTSAIQESLKAARTRSKSK